MLEDLFTATAATRNSNLFAYERAVGDQIFVGNMLTYLSPNCDGGGR